jgi:uncharacterized membrane protein YhhN
MNITKRIVIALLFLTAVCALYRIVPGRPWGFAPQIAMAVFGGAIFINNKKWAFAVPLLSMFLSDVLYEILYNTGVSTMPGFYAGQWENYLLFTVLTAVGFLIKKVNVLNVLLASIAAPTVYFIISNFMVWTAGAGYARPKTLTGLMMCYNDGVPFYENSLYATVFFSAVFFGGYYLIQRLAINKAKQLA